MSNVTCELAFWGLPHARLYRHSVNPLRFGILGALVENSPEVVEKEDFHGILGAVQDRFFGILGAELRHSRGA